MIKFGEHKRAMEPSCFCTMAIDQIEEKFRKDESKIWIVSDARNKYDIDYFIANYGKERVKLVRVVASDSVRDTRGFVFTRGVDDNNSECELDDFETWDLVFWNNNSSEFENSMTQLRDLIYS